MKILKRSDLITGRWAHGTTTQLYISPENASVTNRDFDIRISTATCEGGLSLFTDYTGYIRYICSLDKVLEMSVNGKELKLEPYEIFEFSGSDAVCSKSAVTDFNVIFKKNICVAMAVLCVKGEMDIRLTSGEGIAYSIETDMTVECKSGEYEVKKGEIIRVNCEDEPRKLKADGRIIACVISKSC